MAEVMIVGCDGSWGGFLFVGPYFVVFACGLMLWCSLMSSPDSGAQGIQPHIGLGESGLSGPQS
jgi:hypothetical protein